MKPYSTDLRQKIIDAYKNGEDSLRVIAKRFSVSLNFVWSLWARYKQTGSVEPKPHGGGRAATIDAKGLEVLRHLIHQHNDATLAEECNPSPAPDWRNSRMEHRVDTSTLSTLR